MQEAYENDHILDAIGVSGSTVHKSCLFPVTLPLQVLIQKNPYPKRIFSLPTPNQRKTCIKHIFDQKINAIFFFNDLPTLTFFGPLQETNNFFF